jgi:hypothetical protein
MRTAAEKQPEASLLPISDKPVTLSFKGGLALNKSTGTYCYFMLYFSNLFWLTTYSRQVWIILRVR